MDHLEKYRSLDIDKITDRMRLLSIEHACRGKDMDLAIKAMCRRKDIEAEEHKDWAFAEEQDSMRAYWGHFRRWPNGIHAREARDRFRRRLFWNPPKDRPKPGIAQEVVQSIVSLVIGVAILGVLTIAIFGATYWLFGGNAQIAGPATLVILFLISRYGFKNSFGASVVGIVFCIFAALIVGWLWTVLAG